jgi:hypothetical protein
MTIDLDFIREQDKTAAWLKALIERVDAISADPIPPYEEILARERDDPLPEPKGRPYLAAFGACLSVTYFLAATALALFLVNA